MPLIIDTGVVIPWAAGIGLVGWLIIEIRKDYRKLKDKVDRKVDIVDCEKHQADEINTRKQVEAAVKAEREAHHGKN